MLNTTEINEIALSLLPAMRNMLVRLCACPADVDDAVQDGYLHLVEYALANYKAGNIEAFALSAVKRRYLNWLRNHPQSRTQGFAAENGADSLPDSMDILALAIESQALSRAMGRLSELEQSLCKAYMLGHGWSEAADAIGISRVQATRLKASIQRKLAYQAA